MTTTKTPQRTEAKKARALARLAKESERAVKAWHRLYDARAAWERAKEDAQAATGEWIRTDFDDLGA